MAEAVARRLRRLAEELEENGLRFEGPSRLRELLLEEIDHALRPPVHERRIASSGTFHAGTTKAMVRARCRTATVAATGTPPSER